MTNLKVDIIYYKTSSDFELEFNLTGCCRMRLFKDKIDDRKEFVTALARDVSRSRIILVISDLNGDKNGAETVSAAIGYKYVPLDKAAYSVKSDEDIYVPKGALPLVTKSGQFGGCIIECGKQSIIIVTSDRALRHEIMRSYIHQYIFDINQVEAYNERLRHESENNPIIENSNILTAARKEFTTEMPKVNSETLAASKNDSVPVTAPAGVVIPDEISEPVKNESYDSENMECISVSEDATSKDTEELHNSENGSSADSAETEKTDDTVEREGIDETRDVSQTTADEEYENTINMASSQTDGFEIPREVLDELGNKNEKKLDRRIVRRRKGGNIALLIISILLLLGFGLLAYFLVYLPIITGAMPNNLTKLLEAIL